MAKRRKRRKRRKTSKGMLVRAYLEKAPRWLLEVKTPKRLFTRIDSKFRIAGLDVLEATAGYYVTGL